MKTTLEDWFLEYKLSHTHKINLLIHQFCIPAILFSFIGLIWPYPFLTIPFLVAIIAFSLKLSPKLSVGLILFLILTAIFFARWSHIYGVSLGTLCFILFIFSWILQIIGHKIEGKKPSFLKDLQFLFIGPLWILSSIYRYFRIAF